MRIQHPLNIFLLEHALTLIFHGVISTGSQIIAWLTFHGRLAGGWPVNSVQTGQGFAMYIYTASYLDININELLNPPLSSISNRYPR